MKASISEEYEDVRSSGVRTASWTLFLLTVGTKDRAGIRRGMIKVTLPIYLKLTDTTRLWD
jgi:hypothetical protein